MLRRGRCVAALVSLWCGSAHGASLDLPTHTCGISFGNSPVFYGLRFNLVDRDVQRVIGLNATFWKPSENPDARIDGLMLGLLAPAGGELRGVAVGGLAVAARCQRGLVVAGLGIAAGPMWENDDVQKGSADATGIFIAGLGIGAERLRGIAIGGLGAGAQDFAGVGVGGLGVGAERFVGIGVGGLGIGGTTVHGVVAGGIGAGAQDFAGIGIGGVGMGADRLRGIALGGLAVIADDLAGLGVAPFCRVRDDHRGVTIAVLNIAHRLHGVQIGVVNWASSNPTPLKLLPVFNFDFSSGESH